MITYTDYVKLSRGDKIKVRGYTRIVKFIRGFKVAYDTKKETSSCHWKEIQEIVCKNENV